MGYNQVFNQVFAAHEQRLPLEAVLEFTRTQTVTPNRYAYECPAEELLDVSWHVTSNPVHPVLDFLIEPSGGPVVEAVRTAIDASGITELKVCSSVALKFQPTEKLHIGWNQETSQPANQNIYMLLRRQDSFICQLTDQ